MIKPKGKIGIVLTFIAGIGMVVTIIIASKKAPEAQKLKQEALEAKRKKTGDDNAQLTKLESIKAQAPCYAPVAFSAAVAVGSMIGSQIIPQEAIKDINDLSNMYKTVNEKLNGPYVHKAVEDISNQKIIENTNGIKKETFVFKFNGKNIIFDSTLLDVLTSEYEANKAFRLGKNGQLTFNQLLDIFHADERVSGGDDYGWDQEIGAAIYGYYWIDFEHRRGMLNGDPVTFIDTPFSCHLIKEETDSEGLW